MIILWKNDYGNPKVYCTENGTGCVAEDMLKFMSKSTAL
jgi:hypothetical protein